MTDAPGPYSASARRTMRAAGPLPVSGDTLPSAPVRRRVIPAPFRRPSTSLIGGVRRAWRMADPSEVELGDIVPDVGLIEEIIERPVVDGERPGIYRTFVGLAGKRREFFPGELVQAFQRERVEGS